MSKEYVKKQDGAYRVAGSRISLESIVYAFQGGSSPENIQRSFPALTLEQVYGSIAFYLANQKDIDQELLEDEKEFERLRAASRADNPDLYEKLERARKQLLTSQS